MKAYNFVIPAVWVKPLQVLKRNSGYDSHDATSPSFPPILPPTSAPLLFNEGLGYHHDKIVELKMFVGWF